MKRTLLLLLTSLTLAACELPAREVVALKIENYFSPRGGCTNAIVEQIGQATSSIKVQAYSFTSAPIMEALLAASRRGVAIEVLIDADQQTQKYNAITFLKNNQIPVYLDGAHAIAHNKIIIIDGKIVITGSFNFSKAAEENNAENLLVIQSSELAKSYLANWQAHREHSKEP